MNQHNKIFLIGFMGSGKSTLGKKLAYKLDVDFFDLDAAIEKQEGRSVNAIFESEGEEYFRGLESKILRKVISDNEAFVLALGGGTPCFYDNMDSINQSGISIYLKYNAGILTSRLLNAKIERPLIKGKSEEELKNYVDQSLKEREVYYLKSKFIIENDNLKVEDVIDLIQ